MIRVAAGGAEPSAAEPFDDRFVRHLKRKDDVDADAHLLQRFGLRDGAGEAVEDEAVLAVRFGKSVLEDADDDIVGYERAPLSI